MSTYKKKVYKILVCRKNSKHCLSSKCFWKYFYSLSELARYMHKSSNTNICFPTLGTVLTKEELNILNKKLSSKKTVALMPDGDFKRFYITVILGWED